MKTFAIFTNTSYAAVMIKSECADPTELLKWIIEQPSVNEKSPYFFALEDVNGDPVLLNASMITQIREFKE